MHAIEMAQDQSEYVSTFYWLPLNWAGNLLISGWSSSSEINVLIVQGNNEENQLVS